MEGSRNASMAACRTGGTAGPSHPPLRGSTVPRSRRRCGARAPPKEPWAPHLGRCGCLSSGPPCVPKGATTAHPSSAPPERGARNEDPTGTCTPRGATLMLEAHKWWWFYPPPRQCPPSCDGARGRSPPARTEEEEGGEGGREEGTGAAVEELLLLLLLLPLRAMS